MQNRDSFTINCVVSKKEIALFLNISAAFSKLSMFLLLESIGDPVSHRDQIKKFNQVYFEFVVTYVLWNHKLLMKHYYKVLLERMDCTHLTLSKLLLFLLLLTTHLLLRHSPPLHHTVLLIWIPLQIKVILRWDLHCKLNARLDWVILIMSYSKCSISIPMKSNLDFWAACYLGKLHRLPSFPYSSIYKPPFDLLFVWDPSPILSSSESPFIWNWT